MQYYGVVRSEEYLAHHGRKGQKWGVRNGPPYPLDRQPKEKKKKIFDWFKKSKNKNKSPINTASAPRATNSQASVSEEERVNNAVKLAADMEILAKDGWEKYKYENYIDTIGESALMSKTYTQKNGKNSYEMTAMYSISSDTPNSFKKKNNSFRAIVEKEIPSIKEAAWYEYGGYLPIQKSKFISSLRLAGVDRPGPWDGKSAISFVSFVSPSVFGGHILSVEMADNGKWNNMSLNG